MRGKGAHEGIEIGCTVKRGCLGDFRTVPNGLVQLTSCTTRDDPYGWLHGVHADDSKVTPELAQQRAGSGDRARHARVRSCDSWCLRYASR